MKKKIIQVFLLSTFLFINSICKADDTELFVYDGGSANVLMLFNLTNQNEVPGFLDTTKSSVNTFLNDVDNINIAIVSTEVQNIDGVNGSVPVVLSHFKPVDSARNELITHINSMSTHSGSGIDTNLLLTAWEYYGGKSHFNNRIVIRDTNAVNGNEFISPIKEGCNNNFLMLFTRSYNSYGDADTYINNLAANYSYPNEINGYVSSTLHKIGWLLGRHDVNTSIDGTQTIKIFLTRMPGTLDSSTLNNRYIIWDYNEITHKYSGGGAYFVENPQDLINAMTSFRERVKKSSLLVSPIIPTDSFGFHSQDKKVYFALFKPEVRSLWSGNLKCYKIGEDGIIYDKNNNPAIDETTGFFKDTAHSFWSSTVDGNNILAGGMAEHISKDRKVYSDILDTSYNSYANNGTALSDTGNKLHETNTNLIPALLNITPENVWGGDDEAEKNNVISWARGVDIYESDGDGDRRDDRNSIGDPLHTKPVLVKYYTGDETLYLTTNSGFLHAVNPENGNTIFSFIPRDLLPNLRELSATNNGGNKIYGLDAPMTSLKLDANGDGNILQSAGGAVSPNEAIFLIMPMRRGGRNIYALNVSDRNNPSVAWTIRGGKTAAQQTTKLFKGGTTTGLGDFTKLGQTWSIAMPAMIKWQGTPKVVFFFGGGYDEQTDNQTIIQQNSMGHAIFMVDAISGEKLWQASGDANNDTNLVISGMNHSIVSNLSLVDINQDGFTDFIIATDVGGQVFRIDINNNNVGPASFAMGSLIAQLADNTLSGSRRFFEAANVSLAPKNTHLNIAIGSGFRANPHSTYTQDRIYVIKDTNVFSKPTNYAYANGDVIRETSLYNATDNLIQSGTASQRLAAVNSLNSKHGWYINLEQTGEKLFSKLQTYAGVLTFTTNTPPDSLASTNCQANLGSSSLYALNIENGSAISNLSGDNTALGKKDRKKQLKLLIAPEPSIINRGQNGIRVCVGTECFDNIIPGGGATIQKRYWREN
jgi:type IV pilus assembly protein PilY1